MDQGQAVNLSSRPSWFDSSHHHQLARVEKLAYRLSQTQEFGGSNPPTGTNRQRARERDGRSRASGYFFFGGRLPKGAACLPPNGFLAMVLLSEPS